MNPKEVLTLIGGLSAMKFFPGDVEARIVIAEQFARFAANEDQVRWTIHRLLALFTEWPGVHELRAIHCSRWKPKDGIEGFSGTYLDGIPPESNTPRAGEYRELSPSEMRQISGTIEPVAFHPDATDILHEKIERGKKFKSAPLPTETDIERIKAEQERNRRESVSA